MEILRSIIHDLRRWQNRPYRKPLVLQGARQVGKSWVLNRFGKTCFDNTIYVNFDAQTELKVDFARTKDPKRILQILSWTYGQKIEPQRTLIIFDEIQECNDALNSLKYFCEQAPEYPIVCAGSLLGVALNRSGASFPVGKVDFMRLYPVSFQEYLDTTNPRLSQVLSSVNTPEPLPESLHVQLLESYKIYLALGGMPEAVSRYADTQDWIQADTVLTEILKAYAFDFSKHINNKDIPRVFSVWANLQDQLARDNRKFRYGDIQKGARAREYENAIEWLCLAGLVHRVCAVSVPRLPLSAYKNSSFFKLYLSDVGLLRNKFALNPSIILAGDKLFTEFKGVLSENYVLLSLIRQFGEEQFYWTSGNTAEVEFLLQYDNRVIPIEVKAGNSVTAKSLAEYRKKYQPELAVRLSTRNLQQDEGLLNIPLYLADKLKEFIQ